MRLILYLDSLPTVSETKKCLHNCFVPIKVSLSSEAPLAGISVNNYLVLFALGDIVVAGVSGIPCLVVCKKDGTLVTKEGRSGVTGMVIVIFAS